jgi:hypothetical protein
MQVVVINYSSDSDILARFLEEIAVADEEVKGKLLLFRKFVARYS